MDSSLGQPDASGRLTVAAVDGAAKGDHGALRDLLPEDLGRELFANSGGLEIGLTEAQFVEVLVAVGTKHSYSVGAGVIAAPGQREAFWRGLHLNDLALAAACALGIDIAWQAFIARFREFLERTAIGIAGSSSLGKELADSLYSELYGLAERDGERRSPLASYSGRGSLSGWLRTTLAQRYVNHHRKTGRETPIEARDFAAPASAAAPAAELTLKLAQAVTLAMQELDAEERFLISAYFLDGRTLLEIAYLLRVHEATVSRRLKRLTESLHKRLLKHLEACGMHRRAAQEALGTDPRDLDLNLRSILQDSRSETFSNRKEVSGSS